MDKKKPYKKFKPVPRETLVEKRLEFLNTKRELYEQFKHKDHEDLSPTEKIQIDILEDLKLKFKEHQDNPDNVTVKDIFYIKILCYL